MLQITAYECIFDTSVNTRWRVRGADSLGESVELLPLTHVIILNHRETVKRPRYLQDVIICKRWENSSYTCWRRMNNEIGCVGGEVFFFLPALSGRRPVRQNHSTTWAYWEIRLDTMHLFTSPTTPTTHNTHRLITNQHSEHQAELLWKL